MIKLKSPSDLKKLRENIVLGQDPNRLAVAACVSTGCEALGVQKVLEAFNEEIEKQGLKGKVDIKETGCLGFCEKGPRIVIYPEKIYYFQVKAKDVPEIVEKTLINNEIIERLLYADPNTGKKARFLSEVPFYKHQKRLLLESNSKLDPKKIEDYLAIGGYKALEKALFKMTPEKIMEEIKISKLRGRGGGGFPTYIKWKSSRDADGDPKYVIVNCDEGDPGAFMNRAVMEGNPHSILEGLMIGAYAIGSNEGFIYVRQEYPLAVENMENAIKQAQQMGLLGENILGSGFNFKVTIHRGAGAFVSGESSALMTAIEGKVGEPKPKYVHTSEKGVWDKPSTLNNVETWANIPLIIGKGANWFASIGTEGSKGTKIFALAGKVNNTGLVEVPFGISLRDIIYKIGGGIRNGKQFKGVQTGGPSGGIIPKQHIDSPVDFDELTKLGSMMGSGGLIVMDEDTCMVELARYFVNFLSDESCGKCTPCREGLKQALIILKGIVSGKGKDEDIDKLNKIAEVTSVASLCALGLTSANPLLTTLRYFKNEYEAHITEKKCPALFCKDLISYYIDPKKCKACTICDRNCPVDAIDGAPMKIHIIDQSKCIKCGNCFDMCPSRFEAVKKISGVPVPSQISEEDRLVKRVRKTSQK
jgi:NADH-quinone oxidoreductase subunit F